MISILILLFTLSFVVFVHEMGHFLVGLYLGAKPTELSIGFGKRILYQKVFSDGFKFTIRWAFFGGFVSFHNHQFGIYKKEKKKKYNLSDEDSGEVLSPWKWILINLAGPAANFLYVYFAVFLLLIYTGIGTNTYKLAPESISIVKSKLDKPLEENIVLEFVGGNILKTNYEAQLHIEKSILYFENKKILDLKKTPIDLKSEEVHFSKIMYWSVEEAIRMTHFIFSKMVDQIFNTNIQETLSEAQGPAGMVSEYGSLSKKFGLFGGALLLSIILSLGIGFINLFPLPVLDGGGFLMALWETVTKRPLSDKFIIYTTHTSVIILYVYLFAILIKDLVN